MQRNDNPLISEGLFSKNKQSFLENLKPTDSLTAAELNALTRYYLERYKIVIHVNGQTPAFQHLIELKQEALQKRIVDLKDDSLKYARYLQRYWLPPNEVYTDVYISNLVSVFQEDYRKIKRAISPYLNKDNTLKVLTDDELKNLNEAIKKLSCKFTFDEQIELYIQRLENKREDCCLTTSEAMKEVRAIQLTLNDNEECGYIFTNNHRKNGGHFEVVILTKDAIIKPVNWDNFRERNDIEARTARKVYINPTDIDKLHYPENYPGLIGSSAAPPIPHAERKGCGTLGILYLKELLKDQATQLHDFSLTFQYYDSNKESHYFFFPSPQTLRYSQSSAYNKIMLGMLADDTHEQTVTHKNSVYTVKTLKSLLEDSRKMALEIADKSTADKMTALLENLPSFRERWLRDYQISDEKRSRMDIGNQNRYLSYSSHRLKKKAGTLSAAEPPTDPKIKLGR